jgi:hypothetical protein
MNSHELKTIDELITQALQAQVKDADPPPRVWRQIHRKVITWGSRYLPDVPREWKTILATVLHVDSFFLPNTEVYPDSAVVRVLDLRFATYAGSFFRFV